MRFFSDLFLGKTSLYGLSVTFFREDLAMRFLLPFNFSYLAICLYFYGNQVEKIREQISIESFCDASKSEPIEEKNITIN